MKRLLVLISVTSCIFFNCRSHIVYNADSHNADLYETGIVFGKSIEGIQIGDDATEVIRILGKPSRITEDDFKGVIYNYLEGKFALMFVRISEDPALGLGVIGISVYPPYNGLTKNGVGIGTSRDVALKALGTPNISQNVGENVVDDEYFYEKNRFGIQYRERKIYSISMAPPTMVK